MMEMTTTADGSPGILVKSESTYTIALDYDDTLSLKPEMWRQIIPILKAFGFKVYIVTYRFDSGDGNGYWGFPTDNSDMDWAIQLVDGVLFTGTKAKREFCYSRDIYPDIWVDDTPDAIVFTNCHSRYLSQLVQHINIHGPGTVRIEK